MSDHLSPDQVKALVRWKAEATEVILGLQDLGRALGLPLGVQITGPLATEAANTLRADCDAARGETEALRARLGALADGWQREAEHPSGHSLLCQVYGNLARELRAALSTPVDACPDCGEVAGQALDPQGTALFPTGPSGGDS